MIYIGIDIGKEENIIRFFNEKEEEIRKKCALKNNYQGHCKFKEIIDILIYDMRLKSYDDVCIGIESTGHYWINLYHILQKFGIKNIYMVQGYTVKKMRELITKNRGKNDSIDSMSIAFCLKGGYYSDIHRKGEGINALKRMTRLRNELNEDLTAIKNKIHAWLDVYNQFYLSIFNGRLTVTGILLLENYPAPADSLKISLREFINSLVDKNHLVDRKKLTLYREEVETWEFYHMEVDASIRHELKCYIETYRAIEKTINELEKDIDRISKEIYGELYISLCAEKGMSKFNFSSLLAEIGDCREFKTARSLLAYAGLGILTKCSSGKKKGEGELTKSGNRKIRKYLYVLTRQLILSNPEIKKLYCYYLSYERDKENRKIEMWVATMCKILRCIYGSIKNGTKFDTNEMFKNIDFSKCNMEKFNKLYLKGNIVKILEA
ncbi:IS110 family transposase [Clostridium baratii]